MKRIIKSIITFIIALVGIICGGIWAVQSNWQWEPVILFIVSLLEIVGFIFIEDSSENSSIQSEVPINKNKNEQNVNVNVNVGNGIKSEEIPQSNNNTADRNVIIDSMKSKIRILFIDDDKNFNVVKILKDSGWKNTKTVVDIKSLDIPIVKDADIFFVDINGVGKLLNLEYEGLDLALMLKQKYNTKKVIIYSANKTNNSFHDAWDSCDFKLEKNALPYQFQNLVEDISFKIYNSSK